MGSLRSGVSDMIGALATLLHRYKPSTAQWTACMDSSASNGPEHKVTDGSVIISMALMRVSNYSVTLFWVITFYYLFLQAETLGKRV